MILNMDLRSTYANMHINMNVDVNVKLVGNTERNRKHMDM